MEGFVGRVVRLLRSHYRDCHPPRQVSGGARHPTKVGFAVTEEGISRSDKERFAQVDMFNIFSRQCYKTFSNFTA